jgi:O-antigen/teichoic acid export membrane protein
MSRSLKAFRSAATVSLLGYCAQGLSLVAIPLFLKTVGAEGYGLMVTVMAFMGYLTFADAGLSWGSMILIAQAQGRDDRAGIAHIVRHSAVLALGSGGLALAALGCILLLAKIGWRLPMFAGHPESDRLLLIAGVQLALNLQFGIVYNLFQGLQEAYWAGVYQGCGRLLGLAGAMVAAWATGNIAIMLTAQLGMNFLAGIAAFAHAWHRHPWAFRSGSWTDRAQFVAQLRIGGKNLLLQIGKTIGGTAPTVGISSVRGPAAVPFYTVPTSLLSLFFVPINSWNSSMQSAYGEAWESGDKKWVRAAFRHSLERMFLLGGLGVALFSVLGDGFVRLWTHSRLSVDFSAAFSVAVVTTMAAFLAAGQFLLAGLNCHRRVALAEVASGLLSLILVVLFTRKLGLAGVGLGMACAAGATSVWVMRRELLGLLGRECFPSFSFVMRALAAAMSSALAALLVTRHQSGEAAVGAVQLALGGLAGLAAFLIVVLAMNLYSLGDARVLWRRFAAKIPASIT